MAGGDAGCDCTPDTIPRIKASFRFLILCYTSSPPPSSFILQPLDPFLLLLFFSSITSPSLSSLFSLQRTPIPFSRTTLPILFTMAEEGGHGTNGPASAADHEFTAHLEGPTPVAMPTNSRKSTWTKSEAYVSGTSTPMCFRRHASVDFGDYFVWPSLLIICPPQSLTMDFRSAPEISMLIPNSHISCVCMAASYRV